MDVEEVGGTHSRSNSSKSQSTNVTTPEQSIGEDNDIWASDHEHDNTDGATSASPAHDLLSDMPTIRRQHMTDGYREGLSTSKAKVMQKGFDDGYPIGIRIALRAGKVLGVIEGVLASADSPEAQQEVQKLFDQAKAELAIAALLKDTNDQILNQATGIPESIETVLQKWESAVLVSFKLAELHEE